MKTIIGTVYTQIGSEFKNFTYVFNDAFHASLCNDSSIANANQCFIEAGSDELVGQFGKSAGFAPFDAIYSHDIIEVQGGYKLIKAGFNKAQSWTISKEVDGRYIPVITGPLDGLILGRLSQK